jgi:CubicO group peptidase (beta-lactamase class C family)
MNSNTKKILTAIGTFLLTYTAYAQVGNNTALYKTILSRDSLLFDVGFNHCDIKQFEQLLSDNFEFYHDKNGIADRKKFLSDLRTGLCKDTEQYQARRKLLAGSTEIFALYNPGNPGAVYGAIQNGVHQFYEQQKGQPESIGGSARFSHLWLLENGVWKLAKSYSFEHVREAVITDNALPEQDSAIEKWLQDNKVPALGIGIIENGKLQQIKVFGKRSTGNAAPYNTIFNVASLTKPVTALVALKLVSSGKWSLDEPLTKYWTDPDIATDPRAKLLTTRLVLSHQTGLPNWRWNNADKKLKFEFDPGTKYQYSGEGFEYLRRAMEKKFGKSLQQLAGEQIFTPLKLKDTRYTWSEAVDTARLAIGYDVNGKAYDIVKNKTANAADDLMTSIEDYGTFLLSVLNGSGLSSTVFKEMITPQVASEKGKHFGLGFEIYDLGNGNYALSHGGSDDGVRTIVFLLPKTQKGLLIFTNGDNGAQLYAPLIRKYLGADGQRIIDIEMK